MTGLIRMVKRKRHCYLLTFMDPIAGGFSTGQIVNAATTKHLTLERIKGAATSLHMPKAHLLSAAYIGALTDDELAELAAWNRRHVPEAES